MTLYFNRRQPVAYHQQNILTNDEMILSLLLSLSLSLFLTLLHNLAEGASRIRWTGEKVAKEIPRYLRSLLHGRARVFFFFFPSISSEQAGSCLKGGNPNKKQAMERKRTKES